MTTILNIKIRTLFLGLGAVTAFLFFAVTIPRYVRFWEAQLSFTGATESIRTLEKLATDPDPRYRDEKIQTDARNSIVTFRAARAQYYLDISRVPEAVTECKLAAPFARQSPNYDLWAFPCAIAYFANNDGQEACPLARSLITLPIRTEGASDPQIAKLARIAMVVVFCPDDPQANSLLRQQCQQSPIICEEYRDRFLAEPEKIRQWAWLKRLFAWWNY